MKASRTLALEGLARGEVLVGPQTIHVDLTNTCNTNCVTCWDHSPLLTRARPASWKRKKLSVESFDALLADAASLGGLEAIILSGMGDPFTHPDVYRFIEAVKSRGLHLTIITNLIPADAGRIVALGVDELLIGIHAASRTAYRAFHPSFVSDEWERLLAMLAQFREAGRRYKHVQVICRTNAHELAEMIRFAARWDARQVNFKLASLKAGTEAARIDEAQRARLAAEWMPAAREAAAELGVAHNLDVFAAQLSAGGAATAPIEEIGCFMGQVYARVLVDGTVLYCCNTDVVVGTLADGTRFSELWNGKAWNAIRARMRAGDYFASCSQCGKVNQNVKLAARFAKAFGEEALHEVTGRGADARAATASRTKRRRRSLEVLP